MGDPNSSDWRDHHGWNESDRVISGDPIENEFCPAKCFQISGDSPSSAAGDSITDNLTGFDWKLLRVCDVKKYGAAG